MERTSAYAALDRLPRQTDAEQLIVGYRSGLRGGDSGDLAIWGALDSHTELKAPRA